MSSGLYRLLTALVNLGLVGAILIVGLGIFRASEPPPGERIPNVHPPALAIEPNQAQSNELQAFTQVWQQLDVPKPVVAPPPPNTNPAPPPRPQDLSSRYKVRFVLIDDDDPTKSQCSITSAMGGERGRTVEKGDKLDGYTILSIESEGGDAVVTLDDNGTPRKILLRGPTQ